MIMEYRRWMGGWWLALALLAGIPGTLGAADSLVWHKEQDRVDADIDSWSVRRLLENVVAKTGWKIYLDPNARHEVSVKFSNLPSGEALHALLGNLNFVVIPQPNGPARLYVFRTSREQATRLVRAPPKRTDQPIPNELVVTLKAGLQNQDRRLGALAQRENHRSDGQSERLFTAISG